VSDGSDDDDAGWSGGHRYVRYRPVIFGRIRQRTYGSGEFGQFLAACPGFYRDHFLTQVATGLRSGELLGLRQDRVDLVRRRIEVIDVAMTPAATARATRTAPKATPAAASCPLLVALVWTRPVQPRFVLAWSRWRRRHQARARRAHYQRQQQQLRLAC
jgi:hypothetical protein